MHIYQKMRDSGVVWLGDIPDDWALRRIGQLFTVRNEKVSDKDYMPLSVSKSGIVPQLEGAAKSNDGDNRKKVLKGDFVINSRSDRRGSSGISNLDGSVSLINTVLSNSKLHPQYTHHLLRSYPFQEEFYRWGQGIVADLWSTNYQRMKSISVPLPDPETQEKIAIFLDKETVKIDNLIKKQQNLLELIEEKRLSDIIRATTKGLNPSVKLKDSGVTGIGNIPGHWELVRSSVLFVENKSQNSGLSSQNALQFKLGETISKQLPDDFDHDELRRYRLVEEEDILINGLNLNYDFVTQRVAMVKEPGCITPAYIALRPRNNINPSYATLLLKSLDSQKVLNGWGTGIRLTLNFSEFKKTNLPLPPMDEQRAIVDYCHDITNRYNNISNKIQKQVMLLKERRVSLISNAVTGKIKV